MRKLKVLQYQENTDILYKHFTLSPSHFVLIEADIPQFVDEGYQNNLTALKTPFEWQWQKTKQTEMIAIKIFKGKMHI